MTNLLPPTPNRSFADHERRLAFLERRIDKAKIQPTSRRGRSTFVTVAASDTDPALAAHATYRCDGVDDQVEINEAIGYLGDTGGAVILLPGRFDASGSVTLDRNAISLVGSGIGTVIFYSGSGYAIDVINRSCVVADLRVTAAGGGGIAVRSDQNTVDRVAIRVAHTVTPKPAIHILGTASFPSYDHQIHDCTLYASGHAIGLEYALRCIVVDNAVTQAGAATNNTYDAVHLSAGCEDNVIQTNILRAFGGGVNRARYGINVADSSNVDNLITNNDMLSDAEWATAALNDAGTTTTTRPGNRPGGLALLDADIPATIARDSEVTTAVADHAATPHGDTHPDLAAHDTLGLATQAELDAHAATAHGTGSAEFVPYYLTTDETFTLPEYRQALYLEPIELDGGTLDVEGLLIEVAQPPDLSALVHMAGV